jgi:hypothetical protein
VSEQAPAPDPVVADSPLNEVDPTSLDELFDRVNEKLIAGLPESITADDIRPLVVRLRAQREKFVSEEMRKADAKAANPGGTRKRKATSIAEALDVDVESLI